MANISYTTKLKTLAEALKASVPLAGIPVDIRGQDLHEEHGTGWVELYLQRDTRAPSALGKGIASPYEVTVVIICRVVAPGAEALAAMARRDVLVDALTEAVREQKAAGTYDLTGISMGDTDFEDYRDMDGGGYFSEALVTLNWLTKG